MMTTYHVTIPAGYVTQELFLRHRRLGVLAWKRDGTAEQRTRALALTHDEAEELRQLRGLDVTPAPTTTTTAKAAKSAGKG